MAVYYKILLYKIKAEAVLPFHVGSSEGTDVLVDNENKPYIQANSISGAFGESCERNFPELKSELFGSRKSKSKIVFSDGRLTDFEVEKRPRVKIDGVSGAAEDKAFFNMQFIAAGCCLDFEISVFEEQEEDYSDVVINMLSAFSEGEILLGGQKTNGCGRFRIIKAEEKLLNMEEETDRKMWLSCDEIKYDDVTYKISPREASENYNISMSCDIVNSLIVKSRISGDMANDCESIRTGGNYYVPGSSIKGVIKNQAYAIAAYKNISPEHLDFIFGRESLKKQSDDEGDNGIRGKIIFEDALIENPSTQKMHRVHIDKFTGGVLGSGKFDETVVSGSFTINVRVSKSICKDGRDYSMAAAALALLALRDIGCGVIGLGGLSSVGRGFVSAEEILIDGVRNEDFIRECILQLNSLSDKGGERND